MAQEIGRLIENYPTVWEILRLVFTALVTGAVLIVLLRLEKKAAGRFLEKKNKLNARFVENVIRFVLILLAVEWVIMSSSLTKSFGSVLFQGTSIIVAIAGFAAQPVISDIICGLMLSATKPFELGDRIELDDGTSGIVKDITIRHVVLQGVDTMRYILPNSKLNGMRIKNLYGSEGPRSIYFCFHVSYDAEIDLAMQVIRKAVEDSPYTVPGRKGKEGMEYGPVYFIEYAESSLVMSTTVYYEATNPTERVRSDVNTRVRKVLAENGIEIPYPHVSVVVSGEKKA